MICRVLKEIRDWKRIKKEIGSAYNTHVNMWVMPIHLLEAHGAYPKLQWWLSLV